MTPEALKLLAVVLGRDGGFFDIKANVAARTELGVSGYLRIESHGKQCRLTITPMGRTALALGSKEKPVESPPLSAAAGCLVYSQGRPSCTWPYAAARSFTRTRVKAQFRSTYKTVSAARAL